MKSQVDGKTREVLMAAKAGLIDLTKRQYDKLDLGSMFVQERIVRALGAIDDALFGHEYYK